MELADTEGSGGGQRGSAVAGQEGLRKARRGSAGFRTPAMTSDSWGANPRGTLARLTLLPRGSFSRLAVCVLNKLLVSRSFPSCSAAVGTHREPKVCLPASSFPNKEALPFSSSWNWLSLHGSPSSCCNQIVATSSPVKSSLKGNHRSCGSKPTPECFQA